MQLKWQEAALEDLKTIKDTVSEAHSPQHALRDISAIRATARLLTEQTTMGCIGRLPETFELAVPQSNYVIVYHTLPTSVEVLAIVERTFE